MRALARPASATARAETLLVFLPGRKDRARVFEAEGTFAEVQKRGLDADLLAADAHLGYYLRGTLVERLDRDVIEPARRRGYRRIVLVGVSMGGYGAIRYAMAHPGRVSTIVLLAPFLGAGPFMRDLAEAGDVDFEQTWRWLRGYPADAAAREALGYPRIVLGHGKQDLFLKTDDELAKLLPDEDVVTAFGAHEWLTWNKLLGEMLDRGWLGGARAAAR
jgi:pimeloyl-ACP methyl ester carboxylesterase